MPTHPRRKPAAATQKIDSSSDQPVDIAKARSLPAPKRRQQDDLEGLGSGGGPRSPKAAIETAREMSKTRVYVGVGYCLRTVRSFYGVDALYVSAAEAWLANKSKHPVESGAAVPRGVPVYWLGGSHGYGHIALAIGDGLCWSTDWKRSGYVDLARIDEITTHWGLDFRGYAGEVNGVRVWKASGPGPRPEPRKRPTPEQTRGHRVDDAMQLLAEARRLAAQRKMKHRSGLLNDALEALRELGTAAPDPDDPAAPAVAKRRRAG